MRNSNRLGRAGFAALIACSLTLGATQALATPGTVDRDETMCEKKLCAQSCIALGYDGGRCTGPFGTGDCECVIFSE